MPITLLDFIRSGGDFALMGAKDVEMPDGTRLDAVVQQAGDALAAAGSRLETLETPAASVDLTDFESDGTIIEIRPDGSTVEQQMEFDENKVPIKIRHIVKNSEGEVLEENETSLIGFSGLGGGGGGLPPEYEKRINALETQADAMGKDIGDLQKAVAPAKNIDLSRFESEGKIVQTAADGSTVTSTFTFDGSGNITKVVKVKNDVNGQIIEEHETTLTW